MSNQELQARVKELRELKRMQEELAAEISAMVDTIKAEMGEATELIAGEYKIRWTRVTWSRLDGKALKAALPGIYARFTKESTTRRFTIA